MSRLARVLVVVVLAVCVMLLAAWYERPGLAEYHANLIPRTAPAHPQELTATWLGVTALLLQDGQHAILVDPFFTRPQGLLRMALNRQIAPDEALIAQWLKRLKIEKLDAVIVSHSHFDHAMDAGVVARMTGARLVGSESTLNIGRGAGLEPAALQPISTTDALKIGKFQISFIASAHAGRTGGRPIGDIETPLQVPAHYLDYKLGGAYSILIDHPQGSILHHGSAGYIPGALDERHADVVFLGVALIDSLDPYLRETVDAVGAQRVIPTHWDDFTQPLDQPLVPMPFVVHLDDFFDDMRRLRPAIQVQTLLPAEPVVLFPQNVNGLALPSRDSDDSSAPSA